MGKSSASLTVVSDGLLLNERAYRQLNNGWIVGILFSTGGKRNAVSSLQVALKFLRSCSVGVTED